MPDKNSKAKLSGEQRLEVCALLATGYIPERISQRFFDEYNITISRQTISRTYQKGLRWKKIIARLQREADKQILKQPLAQKVNRIKLLTEAANEAMTWRLERINYDRQGNEISRIEKRQIGAIPAITRELRAEIEGDKPLMEVHTHYTFFKDALAKAESVDANGRIIPKGLNGNS